MTLGPGVALNEEKSPHSATTPVSNEGKAFIVCLNSQLFHLKASARSLIIIILHLNEEKCERD